MENYPDIFNDCLIWDEAGDNHAAIIPVNESYALSINGNIVWEFDDVPDMNAAYFSYFDDIVFFDTDDEHVLCLGIKDSQLMLYKHRL